MNKMIKYTAAEFKVWGYHFKCKARIENSLKVNGILRSIWNKDTKMLIVLFNADIVSLEQIKDSFCMIAK